MRARDRALIEAEIRAHFSALGGLLGELGVLPPAAEMHPAAAGDEGPVVTLKQAAGLTGWSEKRIKRAIVKHRAQHPGLPSLGFQPGGTAHTQWRIRLDLLAAFQAGK